MASFKSLQNKNPNYVSFFEEKFEPPLQELCHPWGWVVGRGMQIKGASAL